MGSAGPAEERAYTEHAVEHCRQRYSWDCGVSCVLMLLAPEQREDMLRRFDDVCREEGFGQSTWTIDLCYLLKRYNIEHCMLTTMLGVNEEYRKHGYYENIIDLDRERVQRRFELAGARGVRVRAGRVSARALVEHVCARGPAVVLLDGGLLACDLCKHNKLKAEFRRCFGGSYSGHYVLVVGYSRPAGKLVYRDPALPARLCATPPARLQRARLASGTDEDVVLVHRDYR